MKFFVILYMILLLAGGVLYIYEHEQVHQIIFANDGIDSKIELFSRFPKAVTIPEENCKSKECILSNNINEAIGYHLNSIYLIVGVGFFITILLLSMIYEQQNTRVEQTC